MLLLLMELGRAICDVKPESEELSWYPAARLTRQAIARSWTILTQQGINEMRDAINAEVLKEWLLNWAEDATVCWFALWCQW